MSASDEGILILYVDPVDPTRGIVTGERSASGETTKPSLRTFCPLLTSAGSANNRLGWKVQFVICHTWLLIKILPKEQAPRVLDTASTQTGVELSPQTVLQVSGSIAILLCHLMARYRRVFRFVACRSMAGREVSSGLGRPDYGKRDGNAL